MEDDVKAFLEENGISGDDSILSIGDEEVKDEIKVESSATDEPEVKAEAAQDEPEVKGPEKDEAAIVADEDKEPVVMANDGKNTIPYSVLSRTRDDLRDAKLALEESRKQLAELEAKFKDAPNLQEKVDEAKAQDELTGTTDAMDELIADVAEDYPGAAKLIKKLAGQVQELSAAKAADDKARIDADIANKAANEFMTKAEELLEGFGTTSSSPEFAEWFAKAPSYIQATKSTSDPAVAADVVRQYLRESASAAAPGDKKGDDKKQTKVDKTKVADAVKEAESKSAVNSLSDIPGGGNPEHDELNAIPDMDAMSLFNKFNSIGRDKAEKMLSRLL